MWTSQQDTKLRELDQNGETMKSMAKALGRSVESCRKRLKLLKEPSKVGEEATFVLSQKRNVSITIICPKSRIGGVIGQNGQTLNQIKESGASVQIYPYNDEEMLLVLSAVEICEQHSPVEDAAFVSLKHCTDVVDQIHKIKILLEKSHSLDQVFMDTTKIVTETQVSLYENNNRCCIFEIVGDYDKVKKAFTKTVLFLRRDFFRCSDSKVSGFNQQS